MTYGIGTVLAAGWGNFFVAVPLNAAYADLDGSKTDGLAYTATPRVGYLSKGHSFGTVALFVGANYLSVDLEVVGTFDVPGVELEIDYTIQQENADNWNGVAGVNWDISQSWAVSVEYNGFVGSREAVVGSLNWRF